MQRSTKVEKEQSASISIFTGVMPNLFRHLFVDETLKQVQGDGP